MIRRAESMNSFKKITSLALTVLMVASIAPATVYARSSRDGWYTDKEGKVYFYEYGRKIKCAARKKDGSYYLLDDKGVLVTKKGWKSYDYQYSSYGDKVKLPVKYYVNADGTLASGWKTIKDKKYYFSNYECMLYKGYNAYDPDDGKYYVTGSDGARITKKGWAEVTFKYVYSSGKIMSVKNKFYLKKGGEVTREFKTIGGKMYCFDGTGMMRKNEYYYDFSGGKYYAFGKDGAQITKKGLTTLTKTKTNDMGNASITSKVKYKVYVNKDGSLATGLKTISGKTYYFSPNMMKCDTYTENGTKYWFGKDGVCYRTVKADS